MNEIDLRIMVQSKRAWMLEEKAQHWAKTHSFKVGNLHYVTMPDGQVIKTDRAGAVRLLVQGWSQYRANN